MRVLILTTKEHWYKTIRENCTCESIDESAELDQTLLALKKTAKILFGMDNWRPFRRKLTDDSFVYIMPCIVEEQVNTLSLRQRQDLIGAFVEVVLRHLKKCNFDVENSEILLVAHDKDLFKIGEFGERIFDINKDLDQNSKLNELIEQLRLIYGYIHKGQPKDLRFFPIIRDVLTKKNLDADSISLFKQKLENTKSLQKF